MADPTVWRYSVTLFPGVSIAPHKFVRVVEVDHPSPKIAVLRVLEDLDDTDTHLWQSDRARIEVERVA